jgi:enoyl-CoA hydratase
MPTALALAHKIAANPPLALQAIKKGLRETVDPPCRAVGKMAITEIRRLMQTADAKESAAAFIQKRKPVFTGK